MNDNELFEGNATPRGDYAKLAGWLQHVLLPTSQAQQAAGNKTSDMQLELLLKDDYHLRFYQQLPDFIMALLSDEAQATLHYASLLYHLAGCQECHSSYLDLYDAMRAAVQPKEPRPLLGQGTRTLSATPQRMLGHLCQSFISQAEAVLRQARHDHIDNDAAARSYLQKALHISARIGQNSIRREALQDLVRVATLFDGATTPKAQEPDTHAYTPVLTNAGGMRGGKKVVRRAETLERPIEQPIIHLQSRTLEGDIIQHEQTLELHLRDLEPSLHGRHVTISVLLGSLIEPVRWRGSNPRAIHSIGLVDEAGTLITPLGETELRLTDPEERNLLEAMFMLLEVRAAD